MTYHGAIGIIREMAYLADMTWEEDATHAERMRLQRLRDKRDAARAEYNAYRKKVKNRIDQARHRDKLAREAEDRENG